MHHRPHTTHLALALVCTMTACTPTHRDPPSSSSSLMTNAPSPTPHTPPTPPTSPSEPSPATRAWMDRLTVPHAYDPATGFIVAKATTPLPPILAAAPPLDLAISEAARQSKLLIVFATADRCAPCQQYKKDALSDPRVLARLESPRLLATHIEVDKHPDLAEKHLGSRAIPMTYALTCTPPSTTFPDAASNPSNPAPSNPAPSTPAPSTPVASTPAASTIATLRGQHTPEELIAWLDALIAEPVR